MKKKRKSAFSVIVWVLLALLILGAVGFIVLSRVADREDTELLPLLAPPPPPTNETQLCLEAMRPAYSAETPVGELLAGALNRSWRYEITGEAQVTGERAVQEAVLYRLDIDACCGDPTEAMQAQLDALVAQAGRRSEVYTEDDAFLPELVENAFQAALEARVAAADDFIVSQPLTVTLNYVDGSWQVTELSPQPEEAAFDADARAAELLESSAAQLKTSPLHYFIPDELLTVPAPPEENFHTSSDSAEIAALLETPDARRLIGDRELVWNPDIEFLEDSEIRCYLDETLLVIQWQQVEVRPVGTFAEIIIADGSQLRRKISGDAYGSNDFMTTSGYAQACNAVLALGGDYYWHHQRICGITVLDGQIRRFSPLSADSCLFDANGDMTFLYRFAYENDQQAEAQQFMDEHGIRFSLAFGPVLIDNGEDVTPGWYPWGEINDTYARSALGMLGDKHYLSVNLNCTPGHYYLATLQDATNALLSRGCTKAYTLDGGQTATTVFHGELVNPVQFGWQKPISDIIYFASALPGEANAAPEESPAPEG